jgi:dihydropteroate synthase
MFLFNCKGRLHSFHTPVVMGIVNITPDSFYSGSRQQNEDALLKRVEQLLQDGAQLIDIGGQSTRPGSERVAQAEEMIRVLPAMEAIAKRFPDAFISIDTYYAKVARGAVERGACLVNDVSAGSIDEALLPTVAELKVPYVLMHMKGTLNDLQTPPPYENLITEIFDFFSFRLQQLHQMGIYDVVLDPGFGFGKTIAQNLKLLQHLSYFKMLQKPLLIGLSRKGTVYKTLQVTAEEALNGTTVVNTIALMNGASILRVHDVKEAVEAIKLTGATLQ